MKFLDQIADRVWGFFSSLKLALSLFIALAVSTLAGSIVLQRPIAEPGQLERVYSATALHWLDLFGLLDVFHSWWYVLQLALLALNLTVVSIEMWPRFRARILSFRSLLDTSNAEELPEMTTRVAHAREPRSLAFQIAGAVGKRFRRPVVTEKDGRVHVAAQSGKYAHLGVYIIHTGIVLILIGGMITGLKGFEGMIQLSPGEKATAYFDRKIEGKRVPLGFELRCLGARMDKYPDGAPKAYFSDLQVVDGGKVVASKTIKVNDPLSYKGIYFYQATFGQTAANERTSIAIEVQDPKSKQSKVVTTDFNKVETLPNRTGTLEVIDYARNIPLEIEGHRKNLGEAVKVKLSETGETPKTIWLFKDYPGFDADMRQGVYHLVFKNFAYDYDTVPVTGIQVARNPGINVTWVGAALLMAGLLSTFLVPHRKLWVVVSKDEVVVAAASHRHPESFGRKVKKLVKEISSLSGGLHDSVAA